jgi:ATP-dependent Zn protease
MVSMIKKVDYYFQFPNHQNPSNISNQMSTRSCEFISIFFHGFPIIIIFSSLRMLFRRLMSVARFATIPEAIQTIPGNQRFI